MFFSVACGSKSKRQLCLSLDVAILQTRIDDVCRCCYKVSLLIGRIFPFDDLPYVLTSSHRLYTKKTVDIISAIYFCCSLEGTFDVWGRTRTHLRMT